MDLGLFSGSKLRTKLDTILYINMSDFLISVNMNKNMDFALKDLKMIHEGKKTS